MNDLYLLVADYHIESLLTGLLNRSGFIRKVAHDFKQHPQNDNGCRHHYEKWVRGLHQEYRKLIVLFDHHGCGDEANDRETIEQEMEYRICRLGWRQEDVCVLCVKPEIEQWAWVNETDIKEVLGIQQMDVYGYLEGIGWKSPDTVKPAQPKEAWQAVLAQCKTRKAGRYLAHISSRASINRCIDPAFVKLRNCLGNWFGEESGER